MRPTVGVTGGIGSGTMFGGCSGCAVGIVGVAGPLTGGGLGFGGAGASRASTCAVVVGVPVGGAGGRVD